MTADAPRALRSVDLNKARDEMDQLCHGCAFDAGVCRCVIDCGSLVCTGWAGRGAADGGDQ
jgi:hypothetical protein